MTQRVSYKDYPTICVNKEVYPFESYEYSPEEVTIQVVTTKGYDGFHVRTYMNDNVVRHVKGINEQEAHYVREQLIFMMDKDALAFVTEPYIIPEPWDCLCYGM